MRWACVVSGWMLVGIAVVPSAHAEKPRKSTPPLPAPQYPMHDTHKNELVTIAAEPCDTKATLPNTRLDYYHHGYMPIRVIITNDSDQTVSLDDARIQFISAESDVVPAATDEELERRLFSRKSSAPTKIPMPPPIPSITIHHPSVDKQILADDNDFGFTSTTVDPHTTAAGYLFYDVRSLDEPVLEKSQLEVRRVKFQKSGKELYSFQIPLKPTPEPKPAPAAEKPGH